MRGTTVDVRRSRMSWIGWAVSIAGLAVLGFGLAGCGGHDDASAASTPAVAPWVAGSCVYQVDGPTAIPTDTPAAMRPVLEARQRFQAVACTDPHAISRIVALGATPDVLGNLKGDSGCPDDTDQIFKSGDGIQNGPLACARNLTGPHPGDPGGGGGPKIIVGDCVEVSPGGGANLSNVWELPCDWKDGHFGKVVARPATPAECPADTTISRLPAIDGALVCIGQAGDGQIAAVGDCVKGGIPDMSHPLTKTACGADTRRVVSYAATRDQCPGGTVGQISIGYDRVLCTRK
jgi:hypothetical protein